MLIGSLEVTRSCWYDFKYCVVFGLAFMLRKFEFRLVIGFLVIRVERRQSSLGGMRKRIRRGMCFLCNVMFSVAEFRICCDQGCEVYSGRGSLGT